MVNRLIGVGVAFVLIFFVAMLLAANARWAPQYADSSPAVQQWFSSQHNEKGQWCCNESDGHRFDGSYWFNADGSVTASEGGKEYKIEKYKVLTGHNPTGSAVWWYIDYGGGRMSYCFSPGSLT